MDGTVELSIDFDDLSNTGTADHDDIDFDLSTPRDRTAGSDLELPSSDPQPQEYQRGRIPSIVITEPSCANLENLGESDHQVVVDDDDDNDNHENQTQTVDEVKSEIETSDTVQEQSEHLDDINPKCENEPENSTSNIDNNQATGTDGSEGVKHSEDTDKQGMNVDSVADTDKLNDSAGFKQENVSNMIDDLHNTGPDKDDDGIADDIEVMFNHTRINYMP